MFTKLHNPVRYFLDSFLSQLMTSSNKRTDSQATNAENKKFVAAARNFKSQKRFGDPTLSLLFRNILVLDEDVFRVFLTNPDVKSRQWFSLRNVRWQQVIRDGDLCKRWEAAPQIMVNSCHGQSEKQLWENWQFRRCWIETRPALGKNSIDTDKTDTFKN